MNTAPALQRLVLPLLVAIAACQDAFNTAEPRTPQALIQDGANGGNTHFFFLPPLVPAPFPSGVFDATLAPTVQICIAASCGSSVIVTYTMQSGITLDAESEAYHLNWHTDEFPLDPSTTYRIRVLVNGEVLGFADVDVEASGAGLKNVDTDEFIGLQDGRTLPIRFRIEEGAVRGVLLQENFDDGVADGWTLTGLWHVSSACADPAFPSPPNALVYRRDDTCTYNTGEPNSGTATFGLDLTGVAAATLLFQHTTGTERAFPGPWDSQRLQISSDGGATFTTIKVFHEQPDNVVWPETIDLTPYVGSEVQLRFIFDTVDDLANDFQGWAIDDLVVRVGGP